MRPLRFLLLLGLFVVLPLVLTCISLFSSEKPTPETLNVGYQTRTGRFRALFSFSTPSSLFPPSAIISLTDDNSTSFLARPASFGPSLPSKGLSGQLWVGKGFGEESLVSEEELRFFGFELGCSDVPGWTDDHKKRVENGAVDGKTINHKDEVVAESKDIPTKSNPSKRSEELTEDESSVQRGDDGTDDHLHHPLPDSNPAPPEKPGEPASVSKQDKGKQPTHADIESLQESADIAGKIVMLSRGGCGFLEKVKWAQRRGGIAVIVGDNEPGAQLTIMYAKGDTSNVTIPAIFISYYSAHLLSTLVPAQDLIDVGGDGRPVQHKDGQTKPKDRFAEKNAPGGKKTKSGSSLTDASLDAKAEKGWMQNVLSAVGLEDNSITHGDDSRRPPGSGNIDWVLLKDWDEDKPTAQSTATQAHKAMKPGAPSSKPAKAKTTSMAKHENDDFIIGVQDWRDTEVIAPKSTTTQGFKKQKGKVETATIESSSSSTSMKPTATALKGGSIIPGSGEYDQDRDFTSGKGQKRAGRKSDAYDKHVESQDHQSFGDKIAALFHHEHPKQIIHPHPDEYSSDRVPNSENDSDGNKGEEHVGLWVTLTPASPSTSPFFDTLLVLVVSPLVTLTFVYGLLLLRSRIRRRRWRAPKSVVDRLPVRTYHTMSSTSSTTSSSLPSPQRSSNSSPLLAPTSNRVRPRSQTTAGVLSSSPSMEKSAAKSSPKRTRYTGRQVECVVCLEEYVDGESKVMSLPCGHEFHVDCITPWLVTRRRTCPICKGDVVRSFSRTNGDASFSNGLAQDNPEQTSDDIQERAAMTENLDGSAAIPIPTLSEESTINEDIERGSDVETPLLSSTPRGQQGRWRGIFGSSLGRLSGDTLWRSSESSMNDRNR